MPTSSDSLRQKFMTANDRDGIGTCEDLICSNNGSIIQGTILYAGEDPTVLEAIQFLLEEWDYSRITHAIRPLYEVKRVGSVNFLCVRKLDTQASNFHVISEHGVNYGSWESVESFVKAYKAAVLKLPEDKNLLAKPLGVAHLSVRAV